MAPRCLPGKLAMLAVALWLDGCSDPRRNPPPPSLIDVESAPPALPLDVESAPPVLPLEVEFAGCASVRRSRQEPNVDSGLICEIPDSHQVRLWIKAPAGATLALRVDSDPRPLHGKPVQGGTLVTVDVADGAQAISVAADKEGARGFYRLALTPRETVPFVDAAESLRQQGKLDDAEDRVLPLLAEPNPAVRAQALGKLALIARWKNEIPRAIALFEEAIALDREAGRLSNEVSDALVLARTLRDERNFAGAHAILSSLDPMDPVMASYPEGRAWTPYYEGELAHESGDLRLALRLYDDSAERSERLALEDHRVDVLQAKADVLSRFGRPAQALQLLDEARNLRTEPTRPCRRVALLTNFGWFAILAGESAAAGAVALPDPIPLLEESLALLQGPCGDRVELCIVLTNLAVAELGRGGTFEARRALDEARRIIPEPRVDIQAWWFILEGRLAVASGHPERALPWYERLAELEHTALLPDAGLRAAIGRARALDALDKVDAARKAYADATAQLDTWSLLVPIGEGRETFLAQHDSIMRLRVDFLVRQAERAPDETEWLLEAADAARRGRARMLSALQWLDRLSVLSPHARGAWERSLEEYRSGRADLIEQAKDDWAQPRDRHDARIAERRAKQTRLDAAFEEALAHVGKLPMVPRALAAPGPAEVMLVYHPVENGWVGLAITQSQAIARRLPAVDPATPTNVIADRLLLPFQGLFEGKTHLRFAPYGPLQQIDFHALPWKGEPLISSFSVSYGMDLARTRQEAKPASHHPVAVLVADPDSSLHAARAGAGVLAELLERKGYRVERLGFGVKPAKHHAVQHALELPGVQLFHYAGHAEFKGRDGWESRLLLAGGESLTPGDIMALLSVPELVILAGCETAKSDEKTPGEGLGLAQAFAAAGADVVVATTRRVNDTLAERVTSAFYTALARSLPEAIPAALREAQRDVWKKAPQEDWASFRVLVR